MGNELWRVGTHIPINVYEGGRPVCQCQTALDAKRIVQAVNADDRDWKRFAEALGLSEVSTREEIIETCRALRRSVPYQVDSK
jgi:hypothetical protein